MAQDVVLDWKHTVGTNLIRKSMKCYLHKLKISYLVSSCQLTMLSLSLDWLADWAFLDWNHLDGTHLIKKQWHVIYIYKLKNFLPDDQLVGDDVVAVPVWNDRLGITVNYTHQLKIKTLPLRGRTHSSMLSSFGSLSWVLLSSVVSKRWVVLTALWPLSRLFSFGKIIPDPINCVNACWAYFNSSSCKKK